MAGKKTFDPATLTSMVKLAQGQDTSTKVQTTSDPNFKTFQTPVNQRILIYFPRTNVTSDENGETMGKLPVLMHTGKGGGMFHSFRCIRGLAGNEITDSLGYDGECPACREMEAVWDLYNHNLDTALAKVGLDKDVADKDTLKPYKEQAREQMDLSMANEYTTFPVVIIPIDAEKKVTADAWDNLEPVFCTFSDKRWNEKIQATLENLMEGPSHPAGTFWMWDFTYDAEGKQHTAKLSANKARYSLVQDAGFLARMEKEKRYEILEEAAKDYTLEKAVEVVYSNQFLPIDEVEAKTRKCVARTKKVLEQVKMAPQGALPQGQAPQGLQVGANPLASFGADAGQAAQAAQPGQAAAPNGVGVGQAPSGDLNGATQSPFGQSAAQ